MPVQVGDTFFINNPPNDGHLYIVASNPAEPELVVVNITTAARWKDQSCLLAAGDHPFVQHDSCIAYDYAKVISTQDFEEMIRVGDVTIRPDTMRFGLTLMERVWDGANITNRLQLRIKKILRDQQLI